jgi:hypothetical protein
MQRGALLAAEHGIGGRETGTRADLGVGIARFAREGQCLPIQAYRGGDASLRLVRAREVSQVSLLQELQILLPRHVAHLHEQPFRRREIPALERQYREIGGSDRLASPISIATIDVDHLLQPARRGLVVSAQGLDVTQAAPGQTQQQAVVRRFSVGRHRLVIAFGGHGVAGIESRIGDPQAQVASLRRIERISALLQIGEQLQRRRIVAQAHFGRGQLKARPRHVRPALGANRKIVARRLHATVQEASIPRA